MIERLCTTGPVATPESFLRANLAALSQVLDRAIDEAPDSHNVALLVDLRDEKALSLLEGNVRHVGMLARLVARFQDDSRIPTAVLAMPLHEAVGLVKAWKLDATGGFFDTIPGWCHHVLVVGFGGYKHCAVSAGTKLFLVLS
jgi:hypothetical protein